MDAVSRFMRDGVVEEIRLLIYDLGGQRVFYTLHHLFLTRNAVYLVVFDMRRFVDTGASEPIDETDPSKGSRPVYDVVGCLRFLRFWLCSLFTHARGAKVLLVGTHGDSMSSAEQHRAVAEQLEEAFSIDNAANGSGLLLGLSEGCLDVGWNDEDDLCFFPVDNSCRPADPILERLKRKVDAILKEEEFVRKPVPLAWYDLHDQLQAGATNSANPAPVLRRSEVAQLAPSLSEEQLELALQLFHQLGMLLYFSDGGLREWVMLDPQFVVDRIGAVVRDYALHPMPSDRKARMLRADWVSLAREGIASEKLLHCLWHKHEAMIPHLTQLLEKLQLACPLPGEPTRYLVPSVLPAVDAAEASGFADAHDCADAHKCWLCLELGGTSNGGIPFLPESLWARLLVKCEQYSMVLNRRGGGAESLNELTRDWALLVFSGQPFLLRRDEASHEVSMLIRDAYPTAVAEQVAQLASEVCAEWMSELLRVRLLVDIEDERFEMREVKRKLRERLPIRHPRTKGELTRADFAPWVPPETESSYDAFIGYRQESESTLAQLLFHDLSARTVGKDGRQLRVFLDRERLQMGERYDLGFVEGLAASSVVVPLLSHGAIEGMEALDPDNGVDKVDYLLVEWQLALELKEAGRVQAIQPILIGKWQPDGAMSNFFTDGSMGRLKDAVSAVTLDAVRDYAQRVGLELSKKAASRTIKQTLEELLSFQTTLWWDLKAVGSPVLESDTPFARMCAELVLGRVRLGSAVASPPARHAPFSVLASHGAEVLLKEVKEVIVEVRKDVREGQYTLSQQITVLDSKLNAQFMMLSTLLRGVSSVAPRLICFLPASLKMLDAADAGRLWRTTLAPKNWLNERVCVFFFDPIRMQLAKTNGGAGFALAFPKAWVAKAMPYVKLGLATLKVAAAAGRLTGFPIPDVAGLVGDWLDQQLSALDELKGDAIKWLGEQTRDPALAAKLLGQVDEHVQAILNSTNKGAKPVQGQPLDEAIQVPLEKSVKELDMLLPSDWREKSGLVFETADDGTSEWVLPDDVERFKREGKKLLGQKSGAGENEKQAVDNASVGGSGEGGGGGSGGTASRGGGGSSHPQSQPDPVTKKWASVLGRPSFARRPKKG